MKDKELNDFISGWVAGDIIEESITDRNNDRNGCGTILFWGFIGFILFSIYAISGVEFSTIWSFLKIITFPITWDYQLLDFKLFGSNNYYSTVGSLIVLILLITIIRLLEFLVVKQLDGKVLNMKIGRFPPVRTTINIISLLFDIFVNTATFFGFILILKIMIHGFLSIFTFIFSF